MKAINSKKISNKKFFVGVATALLIFAFGMANTACARDKVVTLSEVPTQAKQFLSQHFGGVAIQKITMDTDDAMPEYDIYLENGIRVDIDQNGNWEEISTRNGAVPMGVLPQNISTYLAANYPAASVVKVDKDRKGYEVYLNNRVELEFDTLGNFIKIDH